MRRDELMNWQFRGDGDKTGLEGKIRYKKNKGTQNHNDANNSVFIHFETTSWTGA